MRVYAFNEVRKDGDAVFSVPHWVDLKTRAHHQREAEAFFRDIRETHPWTEPYAPHWVSPPFSLLSVYRNPFADVGKFGSITRELFSQRAKNLIGEHLVNDGEFLPLDMTGLLLETYQAYKGWGVAAAPGEGRNPIRFRDVPHTSFKHPIPDGYYWFRVMRYVEGALRLENAMGFAHDPEWVSYLEKYDFHPEKLEGVYLFNISKPTHPGTFATGAFVDLVRKHDLKGLEFQLIWDSEDPDYVDERFKPEIWAEIKARHAKRN
jgi:hypothetical protein